ncbi:MAG: thioredoxin [Anaerostipes sp.]|mgnify:CR=1 FL=1|uniref:thioredoxin n=1 Tax=Anaerostipes sp. 992a TaxID=1261637 RepID=UPI000952B4BB|nr:thioredoxin [Anaerostipes sp. 992a]MCI5951288.1 thioredoxin [Anaerostipes sp.]MDD5967997.1 thioredoxin [Anaerostipes sp.]OLR61006.1 thioredoxin [Anaerostipes sp. 992a]
MAVIKVAKDHFEQEVLKAKQPIILDFWAAWCGPCQVLMPVMEEIAQEERQIKICKINVDEEPELARRYKIQTIPTLVYIKEGEIVDRMSGVRSKGEIVEIIERKLKS